MLNKVRFNIAGRKRIETWYRLLLIFSFRHK